MRDAPVGPEPSPFRAGGRQQWNVSKLVEVLSSRPLHVVEVPEAYTSSRNPFTGRPIPGYAPSVTRCAVRGGRRVKVVKARLRLAELGNGLILDRDVIGAINIGLRYLSSDGRPVALASTGPHAARAKLVTPRRGPTPLAEMFTNIQNYR